MITVLLFVSLGIVLGALGLAFHFDQHIAQGTATVLHRFSHVTDAWIKLANLSLRHGNRDL